MAYRRRFKRYRRRRYRRTRTGRKLRQARFAARVRKVFLKAQETKYKFFWAENTSLYHDRGCSNAGALTSNQGSLIFNPWVNIAKGTGVDQRIGDEILPRGASFRFMYWSAPGRVAAFVRVIVAVIPKVVGTTIMDGGNFDLMDPAGSNDTVTGMIKKEGVKVLYDRIYTMKAQGSTDTVATSGDQRLYRRFYIRSKKGSKISWQLDGTIANKPVGIWVIPYDQYDSLRTDIIGSISFTMKAYWKDP